MTSFTNPNPFSIIKPIAFAAAMLTASSVAESDPSAWNGGTSYLAGQVTSLAVTQKCYLCLAPNINARPDLNVDGNNPAWQESLTEALAWSSSATYIKGARARLSSTHKVYEAQSNHSSTLGGTATVTLTAGAPAVVNWSGHGLPTDAAVTLTTTGVLLVGLTAGVTYYVSAPATNSFSLAATQGGAAISATGTATGTTTATAPSTQPDVNSGTGQLWIEIGSTNEFAAFDDKWGTQTVSGTVLSAWNSGTAYNYADICSEGGRIYKCLIANTNADPASNLTGATPKWMDVGAASTYFISMELTPGAVINSVALLNMLGSSVNISSTLNGQPIYSKTTPLETDIGVYDWYTYFLAPIVAEEDIVGTDLLPYYQQVVTVTLTGPSQVAIGNISMGANIVLGNLNWSPTVGIIDFSTKSTDDFGYITVVERPFSKRFGGKIEVDTSFVDQLSSMLAQIRATPVVWIGAGNQFSSLIVLGFFKDFEVDITYPNISYCTINVEGLV